MTCPICCETYNKSNRFDVECQYCDFHACRSCLERYLVELETEPTCMNTDCKKQWIHEFLSSVMTKTFMIGKYKKHREDMLFLQEVSLMPAAQLEVEKDLKTIELFKKMKELEHQIKTYRKKIKNYEKQRELVVENELKIEELDLLIDKYKQKIIHLTHLNDMYKQEIINGREKKERQAFVRACPANDCRGFLSTQWKCGLCKVEVCKDCHEIKDADAGADGHVCDPNMLASAQALSRDSKTCPKCACLIFKIDGCDQMFCTQCHTAFSWTSHKIVSGRIHNPHYYEWRRANATNGEIPREPGDGEPVCGAAANRLLSANFLIRKFDKSIFRGQEEEGMMYVIHRGVTHIDIVEVTHGNGNPTADVSRNMDLRKKYLKKEISQEYFKIQLQRREKKYALLTEYNNIFTMVVQVATDLINSLIAGNWFDNDLKTTLDSLESLRIYANTCFNKVAKRFNSKTKLIDENWACLP